MPLWSDIKVPSLAVRGKRNTRFVAEQLARIRANAPQVEMAEVAA
jgi:hypothetical protein